jgi:oxygen-independent coproporphyrinogen-3 oxidase
MPVGLYIHVPFCRARCHFCAFYLQIYRDDRAAAYLDSLSREIRLHAERNSLAGRPLSTIYFGGGTPTTLTPDQLRHIVNLAESSFGFDRDVEVSLEAHPDSVTAHDLEMLVEAGFNRISFGLQSTHETELHQVGRRTVAKGPGVVARARAAGFGNISLDLMYGLPSQTLESWRTSLQEVLDLSPTHVSCYALTVEENTHLALDLERADHQGEGWMGPQTELQDAMEEEAVRLLTANGFVRYEISNFCRPGYASRHNLLYWTDGEYLGLGPSAQSYLQGVRFGNVEDLSAYNAALAVGQLPIAASEQLSPVRRRREAIAFGLRRIEGVELEGVQDIVLANPPDRQWHHELERFLSLGWLEQSTDRLRLTEAGRRFADSVAAALM